MEQQHDNCLNIIQTL